MSNDEQRKCLACGGALQVGYIEDRSDVRSVLSWVPGPVERGVFGGLRAMGKQHIEIQAYACGNCGRLELYVPVSSPETNDASGTDVGLPLPADG